MKNIAKPLRNIIPTKLKIFNNIEGWDSLLRNLPVTSLKLKMAITGAIRNDKTVAKSTSSFRLFSNWNTITSAPVAITNKKIT